MLPTDAWDLIARHLGNRSRAENSHLPVAPTIEEHLAEYRHVHRSRKDTRTGQRQLLMFSGFEPRGYPIHGSKWCIQWASDDPGPHGIRHDVESILHAQRLKEPFSGKGCQRLSTDSPHDFPEQIVAIAAVGHLHARWLPQRRIISKKQVFIDPWVLCLFGGRNSNDTPLLCRMCIYIFISEP